MSQQSDSGFKGFKASAAIARFARVKLDAAGTVSTAGLAEKDIGVAQNAAFAAGDDVNVKLTSAPGTFKVIANEALAAAARLYTEASGRVQDTAEPTSFQWGTSLEAATAAGDIIEALPNMHGDTAAP